MIVRVNYKTISREVINALSAGAMELEHVKALRKNVEEYAVPKKKGFITAVIVMVVIFAFMFGSMIMLMSQNDVHHGTVNSCDRYRFVIWRMA